MNSKFALLCIVPALLSANSAPRASIFHMKYEGGTLPLGQGKTHVTVAADKVVFTQGRHALAIPLQNIAMISCNTDVHRRFGAPVFGAVPRLHLDVAEAYYVGLTWTGDRDPASRIEGVFKLSSSEYYGFLATLERLTGRQAVDARRVPIVVRYDL